MSTALILLAGHNKGFLAAEMVASVRTCLGSCFRCVMWKNGQ